MADAGHRSTGKARLKRYAAKRNFKKTAEPQHKSKAARGKKLIFVVQKHAARRLHWDFRLEWEGTLRSWAVPKGPSLDPAHKRLAVEVEDHPIAYAKFEGDIPKGQYGGGHVDIWDNGTWEPVGDFAKGLKKGHLEFEMFGKKLSGRWHLVRTRMQGKQPQLAAHEGGDFAARAGADADVIDAGGADDPKRMLRGGKPATPPPRRSQRHGRAEAAQPRSREGTSGKALPADDEAQLATLVDKAPDDEGWVFELKYDGVRLLSPCRWRRRALHLAQWPRLDPQGRARSSMRWRN